MVFLYSQYCAKGFCNEIFVGVKKHFICDCEVLHLERDVFCIMHGMPSFSHRPLDMAAPDLNVKSCPHVSDFLSSKRPAPYSPKSRNTG